MWTALTLARTHWRALAALVACAAAFTAGALLNGWRLQAELERQRADYEARLAAGWRVAHEAYVEKVRDAEAAAQAAHRTMSRLRKEADEWQTAYNQAKASDPDCAAWASGAIRCPLPR